MRGARVSLGCLSGCLLTSTSSPVFAHSESGGTGLLAGLLHPFLGVDHLLAMVAVGIVSVRMGGAKIWQVPAAFLTAMTVGAWIGIWGGSIPFVESGIAWSVLLLGAFIALGRLEQYTGAIFASVLVFGICHGHAHGVELPRSAAPQFYSMGFLISTIFLHVCGIFIGEIASSAQWRSTALRAFGLVMMGIGAGFVLSSAMRT